MIRLILNRKDYGNEQTRGVMHVYRNNQYLFTLSTLEQEWNNNKTSNSCIKPGFYIVEDYDSEKHPDTFILIGTEPRTYILIHILNYHYQTGGCIGVGLYFGDINQDGLYDLKESTKALNMLREVCANEKTISITIN